MKLDVQKRIASKCATKTLAAWRQVLRIKCTHGHKKVKVGHIMLEEKNSFYLNNEISWKIANKVY